MAKLCAWAGAVPGGCCPPDQLGVKHSLAFRQVLLALGEVSIETVPILPRPKHPYS